MSARAGPLVGWMLILILTALVGVAIAYIRMVQEKKV